MDMKSIERKVWLRYFQDGLWDIYIGIMFMGFAVGDFVSSKGASEWQLYSAYIGMIVLAYIVFWAGKKLITFPRIGRVKFGFPAKRRRVKTSIILGVAVLAGFVLMLMPMLFRDTVLEWLRNTRGAFLGAFFVLVFFGIGYIMDFSRLYIHGLLIGASIPMAELLGEWFSLPFPAVIAFGSAAGPI